MLGSLLESECLPLLIYNTDAYSLVDNQGQHDETHRSRPRHARPPHHAHHRHREAAWLGDRATDPAAVERSAAGQSRLALSGAATTGAPGLDHRRLGRLGKQPPRPILSTDRRRAAGASSRNVPTGTACRRRSHSSCEPRSREGALSAHRPSDRRAVSRAVPERTRRRRPRRRDALSRRARDGGERRARDVARRRRAARRGLTFGSVDAIAGTVARRPTRRGHSPDAPRPPVRRAAAREIASVRHHRRRDRRARDRRGDGDLQRRLRRDAPAASLSRAGPARQHLVAARHGVATYPSAADAAELRQLRGVFKDVALVRSSTRISISSATASRNACRARASRRICSRCSASHRHWAGRSPSTKISRAASTSCC